jgi:hypothetical protein
MYRSHHIFARDCKSCDSNCHPWSVVTVCGQQDVGHGVGCHPCDGRLWSAGRADKHVPRCGNNGRTGTLGAVGELERTVEVSRQRCRSRWRPWCRGLVVSPAVGWWLTPGVFGARHRRPAMRPVRRMMGAQ